MTTKIIYIQEMAQRMGMKKTTIYTMLWEIRNGKKPANALPVPFHVPGRTRWTEESWDQWIECNSKQPIEHTTPTPKQAQKPIGRPRRTASDEVVMVY